MKKIIFSIVFLLILMSMNFSIDFKDSYFKVKYNLYFNQDGIDSENDFKMYFHTREMKYDFLKEPKFVVNLDFKYLYSTNSKYYLYLNFGKLDIKFQNFQLSLVTDYYKNGEIRLYPYILTKNWYVYYKDLNGKYRENLNNFFMGTENEDFDLKNIIKNDEFGISQDATFNRNRYTFKVSYNNKTLKTEGGKFSTSSDEKKYDEFKDGSKQEITIDGSNATIKTYVYGSIENNIRSNKFEYNVEEYYGNLNFSFKTGFLKGFRSNSSVYYKADTSAVYNSEIISANYNLITQELSDESTTSTTTITSGTDFINYKYKSIEKEMNLYYLTDTYYNLTIIPMRGIIVKPHVNLYYKKMWYGVNTLGYDHYMKKRYEFKGLGLLTKEASTINAGLDLFYVTKDFSLYALNNYYVKLNSIKEKELSDAFYLNLNGRYTLRPVIFKTDFKMYEENGTTDVTLMPELQIKYGVFNFDLKRYYDYQYKKDESIDFSNITKTFEGKIYMKKNDINFGLAFYDGKYRRYGDPYFKNFNEKDDKINWYIYFKILKYLDL
ncbi:hypothetical protein OSSY52_22490 [Tepiditoga spiralis]|uniref:Uncharacterized protein n=1 Tax=Tepiditoga spiralis TaxID=2108365 RepID=A0A7G1G6C1_9BACT|nr:hypothetical protein [Tepiditoga spiralis]BBE32108.1 hypothetical protein OSSY52_22490 [Tepiditoga spiralis]